MQPIARRSLIGLGAASAALALAGCGGGGDDYVPPPTRRLWVLNLNPNYPSIDVDVDGRVVAVRVPFTTLTPGIDFEYGSYSIGVRNASTGGSRLIFDGFGVDGAVPPVAVFYANGTSARLRQSPAGIVNYFDSSVALEAELSDGVTSQRSVLRFEDSVPQVSSSANCRLIVRRATDGVAVFDSGVRPRTDAVLIFPADALTGLVAVVGVNGGVSTSSAVVWPNVL